MAKSLSRRPRSHTQSRLGVVPFASGLVTQRAARESLRGPQCRSGKWAGALAPELLALCFFVFVFFVAFSPRAPLCTEHSTCCFSFGARGVRPIQITTSAAFSPETWGAAPGCVHVVGSQEPLGQADVQALASTNELGPTNLPLVVSPEASGPTDVQVVGRAEASGPANAQVVGSKESLVANADVLQAPPLGSAPRGARVYVDVSDCYRSASLTTGPAVARCRSKRLLWKSPPQLLRPLASFHPRS